MSFLYPWAFLLAGLVPLVVALYLQRPRRRKVEVSTLLFWQRLIERQPHRKFLGRLRHPLSLLLQLLIFGLLLLAAVKLEVGPARQKGSTVVVLDSRARMQAGHGAAFSEALTEVGTVLSTAGPDREVALVGAEGAPQIISPFSSDARALREKLAGMTASDGGGSMEESVSLARQLLAGRAGERRLVVVTDRPLKDGRGIDQMLVGKPLDNVSILAVAQRPLPASPQSTEIFVKVGNFSSAVREVELELRLDDRILDLKKFPLAAGEMKGFSSIVPAEVLKSGQGLLQARLNAQDALAVDNIGRATLAVGQRLRVLLVGEDDIFLEQALKSDPGLEMEMLKPASWKPALQSGFDVVIFDNFLPDQSGLSEAVPAFYFGRSPIEVSGGRAGGYLLEKSAEQSPLVWNVDLVGLKLRQGGKFQAFLPGWRVSTALESGGEPALVALEGPAHERMVATSFGVADSNLPLRAGFPLLISNIVHWLAGSQGAEPGFPAGQVFAPASGEEIAMLDAADSKGIGKTGEPVELRKNGFYKIRGGKGSRWLAVNLADEAESDFRQAAHNQTIFRSPGAWISLGLWQCLALIALALLSLEWFLHHRRVTE